MPKMIGNTIHGARQIEDNARSLPERARLSYAQAVMLPPERLDRLRTDGVRNQESSREVPLGEWDLDKGENNA